MDKIVGDVHVWIVRIHMHAAMALVVGKAKSFGKTLFNGFEVFRFEAGHVFRAEADHKMVGLFPIAADIKPLRVPHLLYGKVVVVAGKTAGAPAHEAFFAGASSCAGSSILPSHSVISVSIRACIKRQKMRRFSFFPSLTMCQTAFGQPAQTVFGIAPSSIPDRVRLVYLDSLPVVPVMFHPLSGVGDVTRQTPVVVVFRFAFDMLADHSALTLSRSSACV